SVGSGVSCTFIPEDRSVVAIYSCRRDGIGGRAEEEDFEHVGGDEAAAPELLRPPATDGLARVHVPLGVDGHRVEQGELTRLVARAAEPAEDPAPRESVVAV